MSNNLPTLALLSNDRVIQGIHLKLGLDGKWTGDGSPLQDMQLVVIGTRQVVQLWHQQLPMETIDEPPLVDLDALNRMKPTEDWEIGLDGKPKPPYQRSWIVHLFDPRGASIFTSINSTRGQAIAVERLTGQIELMRRFRGDDIVPIVRLSSAIMKTKFGPKPRPDFQVLDWRKPSQPLQASQPLHALPGKPVRELSTAEIVGEPTWDDDISDVVK